MLTILTGLFFVLHGLVHLLYAGQSARRFELQSGMDWPDGSWAFSKLLGQSSARTLAGILCILAAAGFVIAGFGIIFTQPWWRTAAVASAVLSAVLFILFWNGRFKRLDTQGGVGVLIDMVILAAILIFHWPEFAF